MAEEGEKRREGRVGERTEEAEERMSGEGRRDRGEDSRRGDWRKEERGDEGMGG